MKLWVVMFEGSKPNGSFSKDCVIRLRLGSVPFPKIKPENRTY
jgi:hypothetical protein